MALMHTPEILDKNFKAPNFKNLKGVDGKSYSLKDTQGKAGFVAMFICNHCPYVKGISDRLSNIMKDVMKLGFGVVAINSNDTENYPEDSFENMVSFAKSNGFTFPYVIDETSETAKEYGAICTPDFFIFNAEGFLRYRGRLDSSGMNPATSQTVPELLNAARDIALYGETTTAMKPSMGCSIKFR